MLKRFKQFITEAITDPERESLSTQIFQNAKASDPKLTDEAINQIKKGLNQIQKHADIVDYVLMGSILTLRYTDEADLDILVLIDANEQELIELRSQLKYINEKLVDGTTHPVNYFVTNDKKDFQRRLDIGDGAFDIKNNKFIRKPIHKDFDISQYWQEFINKVSDIDLIKSELKRDLIDYKSLKHLKKSNVKFLRQKLQDKLKEMESGMNDLITMYDKIKDERRNAFDGDLTDKELRQYGERNRLPANVIYKLLERYHYLDFLKKIDKILGDDKELSPEEAKELANFLLKKN